jgi:hypothetical protein
MKLYLVGKSKATVFEVLKYDPATHRAVLRGVDGTHVDGNFHPYMVRRVYAMVHEEPESLKGK